MKKSYCLILFILLLVPFVLGSAPDQTTCECNISQLNTVKTDLIVLNQTYNQTLSQLADYMNSTNFYKDAYESKNITVTNRELMNIYNSINIINMNISQLNQRMDHIENKFTLFSIEVGLSVIGLSAIEVVVFEIVVRWWRNRKKNQNGQGQ